MPVTSTSIPHGYHGTAATAQTVSLTVPQKWEVSAMVGLQEIDTFKALEGSNPESAFVWTRRDASLGSGHIVHFRTASGFYGEGKRGANTFSANSDFEQRKYGQYGALIGVHRHASSDMEATNLENALEVEVADGTAVEEGRWMGRRYFENTAMTICHRSPLQNRMVVNQRSFETLRSTDILDRTQMVIANGYLKQLGGGLANVSRDGAQIMMRTTALAPSVALTRLKLDPAYQRMAELASARGQGNPVFNGEVVDFDNCLFREHHSFWHAGDGPQGSVFAPMAKLKGQCTVGGTEDLNDIVGDGTVSATALFDMTFGENSDDVFYTKWFPGYNYIFNEYGASSKDTLGSPHALAFPSGTNASLPSFIHGSAGTTENIATGGEHYLMIINPPQPVLLRDGSYSVPNAIGFYAYTIGNNGKRITITRRLGASASGSRVTTLPDSSALGYNGGTGIVTWGAGSYGGATLGVAHPKGSTVLPCNAKGVAFGYVPVLGGGAVCRGIGKYRVRRGGQTEEDGFIGKMFTRGYFGNRCNVDRAGNGKLVVVTCALSDPALPLPVVTA